MEKFDYGELAEKIGPSIEKRLRKFGHSELNEESIRTDLLYSLWKQGVESWEIVPEARFRETNNEQLDLTIGEDLAFELKYLREIETSSNRPRAMWLGHVLRDLLNLKFSDRIGIFLVLYDPVFENYMANKNLRFYDNQNIEVNFREHSHTVVNRGLPNTALKQIPDVLFEELEDRSRKVEFHFDNRRDLSLEENLNLSLTLIK